MTVKTELAAKEFKKYKYIQMFKGKYELNEEWKEEIRKNQTEIPK